MLHVYGMYFSKDKPGCFISFIACSPSGFKFPVLSCDTCDGYRNKHCTYPASLQLDILLREQTICMSVMATNVSDHTNGIR